MFSTLVVIPAPIVISTVIIMSNTLTHIIIPPRNGPPIIADSIISPFLYSCVTPPIVTVCYCVVGATAAIIVDVVVGANAAIVVIDIVVIFVGAVAAIVIIVICVVFIVIVALVICPTDPPKLGGILPTPPAPTRSRGAHKWDLTLPREQDGVYRARGFH